MKCCDVTRKRENGYSYKEANPFLSTYPLPQGFLFIYYFLWEEGVVGNFEKCFLRKN